ncbi:SCO2521 family protein [Actinoplanes sp. TRM 88003]|uniref:SCO2521 family protein n=1 Tax=Paractinoplanes aksuensis TaxID=2939490 RepID=A0ABT1DX08_9ACTN|nr:SCO2521 family protein [Actinoplanes aksuensis]MCO8275403.1 SCO2521 family protein [Actinoplanes aksuensis]
MFGEIHTGLLQNSTALSSERVSALLDLVVGERVRRFERPVAQAVSPDKLTGVDCDLPSSSGRSARGVGTIVSHAIVTGGHCVQGSSYAKIEQVRRHGLRLPWSHYLARPGTIEPIGKVNLADVADGFLGDRQGVSALDVGAISDRAIDEIQASRLLDRLRPFRSSRTVLRWAVSRAPDGLNSVSFVIESKTVRTLLVRVDSALEAELPADAMLTFAEELARRDWLLTVVLSLLDRSLEAPGNRPHLMSMLHPAVEFLLHLWMPSARVDVTLLSLWESLDRQANLSNQWRTCVDRIRDQLNLSTIALLEATAHAADRTGRTTAA